MRFRNVRNQEAGTAAPAVGGEEVRFRNVKMRQKRTRPSAGRPKSEVVIWKMSKCQSQRLSRSDGRHCCGRLKRGVSMHA